MQSFIHAGSLKISNKGQQIVRTIWINKKRDHEIYCL